MCREAVDVLWRHRILLEGPREESELTVDVERARGRARDDLVELDEQAYELIRGDGLEAVAPRLEELVGQDLRGRPRVRLLVALLLASEDPDDPRVDRAARSAWRGFQRSRDRDGMALAAFVLGRIADRRGDLEGAAAWWARSRAVSGGDAPVDEVGLVQSALRALEQSDLLTARRLGEEAIELSRSRENQVDEVRGIALLAMLATHEGDFEAAETLAESVLEDFDESVPTVALLHGVKAVIAAHRGRIGAADQSFARMIEVATRHGDTATRGVGLAQRVELLADRPVEDRVREAWTATALLAGNQPWSRLATRAVAVATADAGDRESSEQAIESLLAIEGIDGTERGRALLIRASNARRFGGGDPKPLYEEAYRCLLESNARYWAARAAMCAAECDGRDGGNWRDRAAALSNGDEAFVRLLRTEHALRIDSTGGGQVVIDGQPVQFLTRHAELALYMLALAGRDGIGVTELATRLWPSAPPGRYRPRLRTCL